MSLYKLGDVIDFGLCGFETVLHGFATIFGRFGAFGGAYGAAKRSQSTPDPHLLPIEVFICLQN